MHSRLTLLSRAENLGTLSKKLRIFRLVMFVGTVTMALLYITIAIIIVTVPSVADQALIVNNVILAAYLVLVLVSFPFAVKTYRWLSSVKSDRFSMKLAYLKSIWMMVTLVGVVIFLIGAILSV